MRVGRGPRRSRWWVLVAVLWTAWPTRGLAQASPDKDLQEAIRAYNRSDFGTVISLLNPLLYPTIRFSQQRQTIEAYKLLGIGYVFEKNRPEAEKQFLAILSIQPGFRLDPLVYPEAAVGVFEEVKRHNAEKIKAILERERREQERRRERELEREAERRRRERLASRSQTVIERTVATHSYWINFLPLGLGQFQNGHRLKGYFLMGSQLGLAALSMSLSLAVRFEYANRQLTVEEHDRAQTLTAAQIVSGGLCVALAVYGVIDALIYYKPQTVRQREFNRKVSGIYVVPSMGSGAAALELGIRF